MDPAHHGRMISSPPEVAILVPASWLIRVPEVFSPYTSEILTAAGAGRSTPLGPEYHLIRPASGAHPPAAADNPFISWNLPVHHSWPCHPPKMEQFVEKAAQALHRKFSPHQPQSIQMGPLHTGVPDRYYKNLASNLRGRTLQLFPGKSSNLPAEEQDPAALVLFCLVGREGLFAGMQSPRSSNGFHPGGTKFISQGSDLTISRAGAKIAEALHYLKLHRAPLPPGSHWLELGASPGGMTSELLNRQYKVTALDRAPLDARLNGLPGLDFRKTDVATFTPPAGTEYHALLCDMNGDARQSLRQVIRLSKSLRPGGLIVFTLKTPGATTFDSLNTMIRDLRRDARQAGLGMIALTHLTYNRQEFTCFMETPGSG